VRDADPPPESDDGLAVTLFVSKKRGGRQSATVRYLGSEAGARCYELRFGDGTTQRASYKTVRGLAAEQEAACAVIAVSQTPRVGGGCIRVSGSTANSPGLCGESG
jgi:hypothetical protein